jgi:hypothetical protein
MRDFKAQVAQAWFATGAAFLLASCATTPEITSYYDRSANFAAYHTFALLQRPHPGIPDPLVATRAAEGHHAGNATEGLHAVVGAQDRIAINSYPTTYGGPIFGSALWGNIDLYQYHEGTLGIDVFDQHTRRPVWHRSAQQELSRKDMEEPAEPISKAVSSVLARFPPV